MLPLALLNQKVTIKRRVSTGADVLNNPTYGAPTDGSGWSTIYSGMPVRLAFSSKVARFAQEGERIQPAGVMYYNNDFNLRAEDRVLVQDATGNTIEYNIISVVAGTAFGSVVDHYEAILQLP